MISYEHQQQVLELYVKWLNGFEQNPQFHGSVKDFTYDGTNHFGSFTLKSVTPSTTGQIEIYDASTGDEGGPATLTVFRATNPWDESPGPIDLILQNFEGHSVVYVLDPESSAGFKVHTWE